MSWFYAIQETRHGPISASELANLSRSGEITAETLAWKEGMEEWLPFQRVADRVFAEEADDLQKSAGSDSEESETSTVALVETGTCAYSNRVLPKSELVPYGDRWLDPQHKDAFVQQLMESGKIEGEATAELDRIPVGFWWRLLSYVIDYFVILIPSLFCMIPFWVTSAGVDLPYDPDNPFAGWTTTMGITYALGAFASFLLNGAYHTWLVGRYRATVGKMAIGAIVANPDGSRITYGRSFARWICQVFLNGIIGFLCAFVVVFLGAVLMGAIFAASGNDPNAGGIIGSVFLMIGAVSGGAILGMFPYWMAAFDREKRALHDRVCATRVIKKLRA